MPVMSLKWWTIQQLKSRRASTRKEAVERLGPDDGALVVKNLLALTMDPDPQVRKAVMQALGRVKGEQVLPPLMSALHDPDGEVREAAVVSLTQIGDPRAIDPLARSLEDPRHEVRWRAVKALDALGWQPATEEQRVLRAIAAAEFSKAAAVGALAVERLMAVLKDVRNPNRHQSFDGQS